MALEVNRCAKVSALSLLEEHDFIGYLVKIAEVPGKGPGAVILAHDLHIVRVEVAELRRIPFLALSFKSTG